MYEGPGNRNKSVQGSNYVTFWARHFGFEKGSGKNSGLIASPGNDAFKTTFETKRESFTENEL